MARKPFWLLASCLIIIGLAGCGPALPAATPFAADTASNTPTAAVTPEGTAEPESEPTPAGGSPGEGDQPSPEIAPTAPLTAVPISPTLTSEVDTVAESSPVPINPAYEEFVNLAKEDLAKRLGIDAGQIEVVEARAVEWRDTSLGCPQPGMAYAQVLQDGLLIILRVDGRLYEYHSGRGRPPFLCEQASQGAQLTAVPLSPSDVVQEEVVKKSETPAPTPASPFLQKLVTQASEDLARRLGIDVDQIDLVEFKAVVWPDGSLGCPRPDMAYIQVQQEGTLIRLQVGGRIYEYHSGGNRPPFLCEQPSGKPIEGDSLLPPPGGGMDQ